MKYSAACRIALSAALVLASAACDGKKEPAPGTAASAATAATAATGAPASAPSPGTVAKVWTGSQPAADGGAARKVTLEMKADGTGLLTIDAGGKVVTRNGKWAVAETAVSFDPIEKDGSPGSRVVWALNEGRLSPIAWSGDDWGTSGPPTLDKAPK